MKNSAMIQTKKQLVKWKMKQMVLYVEIVGLKSKIYLFIKDRDNGIQKLQELITIIKILSRKRGRKSAKMFCWRRNVWNMKGEEYKKKL